MSSGTRKPKLISKIITEAKIELNELMQNNPAAVEEIKQLQDIIDNVKVTSTDINTLNKVLEDIQEMKQEAIDAPQEVVTTSQGIVKVPQEIVKTSKEVVQTSQNLIEDMFQKINLSTPKDENNSKPVNNVEKFKDMFGFGYSTLDSYKIPHAIIKRSSIIEHRLKANNFKLKSDALKAEANKDISLISNFIKSGENALSKLTEEDYKNKNSNIADSFKNALKAIENDFTYLDKDVINYIENDRTPVAKIIINFQQKINAENPSEPSAPEVIEKINDALNDVKDFTEKKMEIAKENVEIVKEKVEEKVVVKVNFVVDNHYETVENLKSGFGWLYSKLPSMPTLNKNVINKDVNTNNMNDFIIRVKALEAKLNEKIQALSNNLNKQAAEELNAKYADLKIFINSMNSKSNFQEAIQDLMNSKAMGMKFATNDVIEYLAKNKRNPETLFDNVGQENNSTNVTPNDMSIDGITNGLVDSDNVTPTDHI